MRAAGVIALFALLIAITSASVVNATEMEDEFEVADENEFGEELTLDETPTTPSATAAAPTEQKQTKKVAPQPVPKSTKGIVEHESLRRAAEKAAQSQTNAERLAAKIVRREALRRRLKRLKE